MLFSPRFKTFAKTATATLSIMIQGRFKAGFLFSCAFHGDRGANRESTGSSFATLTDDALISMKAGFVHCFGFDCDRDFENIIGVPDQLIIIASLSSSASLQTPHFRWPVELDTLESG